MARLLSQRGTISEQASQSELDAFTGSANIATVGTVTSGTISTGTVMDDPTMTQGSDATGDVYYRAAGGALTRLATGADGTVLTSTGAGAVPAFEAVPSFDADAAQVFNESGADVDFRVESDDNANMFFVDGGEDRIGIGTNAPDSILEISSADDTRLKLTDTGDSSELEFRSDGTSTRINTNTNHDLNIFTNGNSTQLYLDQGTGGVGIGTVPAVGFQLEVAHPSSHSIINIDGGGSGDAVVAFQQGGSYKYQLYHQSDSLKIYDYTDGSVAVHIAAGGTSWVAGSDERMKKDIVPMEDRLDDLLNIKVRRFTWKHSDKESFGFIAQELKSSVPEAVEIGTDEVWSEEEAEGSGTNTEGELKNPYGISRELLIPMMVKSIQELSAKNDALEAENTTLKTRMDALEARVLALESA